MTERYDPIAMTLHWLIAFFILLMIPMGFLMEDLPLTLKLNTFTLHKSIGLTVLGLSLLRLVWRLLNPPPALPASMTRFERTAAIAAHWALYALMILMPLTGWLMVSASQKYPTIFFWLGEAPFLPLPADMVNRDTAHNFGEFHETLALGAAFLIALHVGAALQHHFKKHDTVLIRMLPGRNRRNAS